MLTAITPPECYAIRYPPSTGTMAPVTNCAAGEHKNTAAPAMSRGSPHRASGVRARIASLRSGSSRSARVSGVRTHPGAMALTRIPSAAYASASDLVSCATPPLLALYPGTRPPPWNASTDAVLTIEPLPRPADAQLVARERAATHRTGQVDGEHLLEDVDVVLGVPANDARAMDEDDEDVEARQIGDRRANRARVADIDDDRIARREAGLRQRRPDLSRRRSGHRHDGTGACQSPGDRRSDTARASDDQRHPPGEHVGTKRRRDGVGTRTHSTAEGIDSIRSTSAARGSGATAPYPVVASAAAAFA